MTKQSSVRVHVYVFQIFQSERLKFEHLAGFKAYFQRPGSLQ